MNSEKLKNGIKILVGQTVLVLLLKTIFCMFSAITQEHNVYLIYIIVRFI